MADSQNDATQDRPIEKSLAKLLTEYLNPFLKEMDTPLPFYVRFLSALFGTFTYATGASALALGGLDKGTPFQTYFGVDLFLGPLVIAILTLYCMPLALLIAGPRTRYGPVRLYLLGFLLLALSVSIVRVTAW